MSGGGASSFPLVSFGFWGFFLISPIPATFLRSPDPRCYPSASLSASSPVSLWGSRLDLHTLLLVPLSCLTRVEPGLKWETWSPVRTEMTFPREAADVLVAD